MTNGSRTRHNSGMCEGSGLRRQSRVALGDSMGFSVKTISWRTAGRSAMAMAVAVCASWPTAGSAQGKTTAVRRISTVSAGAEVVVTIEADGPLPAPTLGTVDDPPRIFLDFAGVVTRAPARTPSADSRIRRVRVALNQATPPITRVVIDLPSPQPHRVERLPGKVIVIVGSAAQMVEPVAAPVVPPAATPPVKPGPPAAPPTALPDIPPVPDLPPAMPPPAAATTRMAGVEAPPRPGPPTPSADPAPKPNYRPVAPSPSAKDLQKYKAQAGSVIDQLRLQQPLLESLNALDALEPERLQLAFDEFDRITKELSSVAPTDSLRTQHDLFLQASRLGRMAVRLRIEAGQNLDPGAVRNAASAAAGAILTLDRACADVGCPAPPGR
jgi:AMIN domain